MPTYTPPNQQQGGGGGGGGQYQDQMRQYRRKLRKWKAAQYDEPKTPDFAFDAATERALADYQRQGDTAVAQGNQARQSLFSQNFDPNNPFNAQALLEKSAGEARASTGLSFGKGGNLYSGAHEAQQARNAFTAQQQQDQLYRDYLERLGQVNEGQTSALDELSSSADDALFELTQRTGAADAGTAPPQSRLASRPKPKKPKRGRR